ncbi:hypothetical protein [Flagellimonas lutaonensis]|uniref:Uncharacterized protein n=1 Tax=Flagellimonas lutaonensis TaxID=516051 RepID=A0A0D5YSW0_9FLAO|nr:hypothetical protein [Allomuricauda lutaonensis]AKA34948.1 hypothetical protein VC82_1319 [Allomuricauda lutaonensis]MAU27477.1 hypothetical protein [Allomuricauda sp.]|tara:strand:+ start:414 stop:788 length:375 start_codon:yes stop_codon:yes gene_type:complete
MVKLDKKENKEFLEKSINHLEAIGFKNIKADLDGYDRPKSYVRKASDTKITPDIVAVKNGRKYFFDISLKSEKPRLLKTKWLFLDTLSRMNSNRFRIITTKGHYKFTDAMLADINLTNKNPIKI